MHKIDIVYLWVDGSDKKWLAIKNKWLKKLGHSIPEHRGVTSDERYRDNGEFLYSVRSVAENMPWVNHIYIITGFGQVPKWLNTKHPKITIVPHEQIMPADALPTFNSTAIEMCIPNIPNLSEHFVVMNDDIFVNKKLSPSFFFDRHGNAKTRHVTRHLRGKKFGNWLDSANSYLSMLLLSTKMIEVLYGRKFYKYAPSHSIDPYLKSMWIKCRNNPIIKPIIDNQIKNKFRTSSELHRWMFGLYQTTNGRGKMYRARPHKSSRHKISDAIYNFLHWYKTGRSSYVCPCVRGHKKSLRRAAIFCINDSSDNTPEMLRENFDYISNRFSRTCEFEKPTPRKTTKHK
ncbi:MAG: Stealth CR1 domain-containing protein [Alphaproteobacteria bacterium]|nr:Stealth CR1 domain-containing protein [Alphaproteobacteria bacterium]